LSSPVRLWLVTGPPGIGKSTLVSRVIYDLRSKGIAVGGCLTKEVRAGRERVGFKLADLLTGVEVELASVKGLGPRVGRYRVNIVGLSKVGAPALVSAVKIADVIVVDEVGPMELTSPDFRKGAVLALNSGKPMLVVLHESMKDPLMEEIRAHPNEMLALTLHNREGAAEKIAREITLSLQH